MTKALNFPNICKYLSLLWARWIVGRVKFSRLTRILSFQMIQKVVHGWSKNVSHAKWPSRSLDFNHNTIKEVFLTTVIVKIFIPKVNCWPKFRWSAHLFPSYTTHMSLIKQLNATHPTIFTCRSVPTSPDVLVCTGGEWRGGVRMERMFSGQLCCFQGVTRTRGER